MSNSLDPDQAQCFVGPDLGLNCLQRLSAEDNRYSDYRVKSKKNNMFLLGKGDENLN